MVSTHIPANRECSRHVVFKNKMQALSLLLFCSWDRIKALMLIFTTNNRAICVSRSERQHCKTLLAYCWIHQTSPWGWTPPSQISPIIGQRRLAYEHLSFRYIMTGAESEQPVGAPFYQWVGCRDHSELVCFPHSGGWLAQGGKVYVDIRENVFSRYGLGLKTSRWCTLKMIINLFS